MLSLSSFKSDSSHKSIKQVHSNDIAIIGMSIQLPQSASLKQLWGNLVESKSLVRPFPNTRKKDTDVYLKHTTGGEEFAYIEGAYLENIDYFDHEFFHISYKEACCMDPNQRLFIQCAWKAFEDAGYSPSQMNRSRTGIFLGYSDESWYKEYANRMDPSSQTLSYTSNIRANIAYRLAYMMNLSGPTMLIDTTCSSALAAIHLACQSLQKKETTMALVGSVKITSLPLKTQQRLNIFSSDYQTKAFDYDSDGTGIGEGVAAVLLKPLHRAVYDNDSVYAVIKGSAMNSDGKSNGITSPNPEAQTDVLIRAWENAGINPEELAFIEAHGTGTQLGDSIELQSINQALRRFTKRKQFCAVGTIKSNMGHLDHAAGMAGLVKAVLSLNNRVIPPTLHVTRVNESIQCIDSSLYINTRVKQWALEKRMLCGINAFGLSGTNCHIVLEEYVDPRPAGRSLTTDASFVFVLSAQKEELLRQLVKDYIDFLGGKPGLRVQDVCYTVCTGRMHHPFRLALVVYSLQNLKEELEGFIISGAAGAYDNLTKWQGETEKNQNSLSGHSRMIREYLDGRDVDWSALYEKKSVSKVSLPSYPFAENRCWIEPISSSDAFQRDINPDHLFYDYAWVPAGEDARHLETAERPILVLTDDQEGGRQQELVSEMRERGLSVIHARLSGKYHQEDDQNFYVTSGEDSMLRLLLSIKETRSLYIIHMYNLSRQWSMDNETGNSQDIKDGLLSLFSLVKGITACGQMEQVEFRILTQLSFAVEDEDEVKNPVGAAALGFHKTMREECHGVNCRYIDTDGLTGNETILNELMEERSPGIVSLRNNKRYVQAVMDIQLKDQTVPLFIREHGVYAIIGGSGAIGTHICHHLAQKGNINMAVIGRRKIQEEGSGELTTLLESVGRTGSSIDYYQADVTNRQELFAVLDQIKTQHGIINGIIHCAATGVGEVNLAIADETYDHFEIQMGPKVQGSSHICEYVHQNAADFVVFFASAVAVTGGIHCANATVSNWFLNGLSEMGHVNSCRIGSINWVTWSNTHRSIAENKQLFKELNINDALGAFDRFLRCGRPHAIIGRLNLKSELWSILKHMPFEFTGELRVPQPQSHKVYPPVTLTGKEDGQYQGIERQLGAIICSNIGAESMNINDEFFELGIDSILAVRIVDDIEKIMFVEMEIADLAGYNTIAKLSSFISKKYYIQMSEPSEPLDTPIDEKKEDLPSIEDALPSFSTQELCISGIRPFTEYYFKSCYYNALFSVMDYYGLDHEDILLNDIITYNFDKDMPITNDYDSYSILYLPCSDENAILYRLGLAVQTKNYCADIMEEVKNSLNKGNPVIVWVDCFYNEWRKDVYQKQHVAHTLLLYGYSDKDGYVMAYDHRRTNSLKYILAKIPYKTLTESYNGFINNFANKIYVPSFSSFGQAPNCGNKIKRPSFPQFYQLRSNEVLAGIGKMTEEIRRYMQMITSPAIIIEFAEGFGKICKPIVEAKIAECYQVPYWTDNKSILENCIAVEKDWSYVRSALEKISLTRRCNQDLFSNIIARLGYAMDNEKALFDEINEYIHNTLKDA